MAMKYGFFNGIQQADGSYDRAYDAEFFTRLLSSIIYQGVPSDAFNVTAGGGLNLNVSSGYGFVGGVFFYDDEATTLYCSSASATRTDFVVARLNTSGRTVELAITQSPAANDVALAQVTVSGSTITDITQLHNYYNYGAICGYADNAGTIDGHAVYVQSAQPTSPSTGDLWFW